MLQTVVKMVNSIKSKPLNCRVFQEICGEVGAEHQHLLFHNSVRWLSRGRVLSRFYGLLHEFNIFVIEHKNTHGEYLRYIKNDEWKVSVAYLTDIFAHLNELNLKIQGKNMNVFTFMNQVDAFKKKLLMWKNMAKAGKFDMFESVSANVCNNEPLTKFIAKTIDSHLEKLIARFDHYFPPASDPREKNLWIVNPFVHANEPNNLNAKESAQLLGN